MIKWSINPVISRRAPIRPTGRFAPHVADFDSLTYQRGAVFQPLFLGIEQRLVLSQRLVGALRKLM